MALKDKRIITVAVTGAWPTRKDNSNLPVTPSYAAIRRAPYVPALSPMP